MTQKFRKMDNNNQEVKVLKSVDIIDLYRDGIKINNREEKEIKVSKELRNFESKIYGIMYPGKEGRRNFRNLDGEKKEEIYEQYPMFRKNPETKAWEYRTNLRYFEAEEDGQYIICSSYVKVSSALLGIYMAACYTFTAYCIIKYAINTFKNLKK